MRRLQEEKATTQAPFGRLAALALGFAVNTFFGVFMCVCFSWGQLVFFQKLMEFR